MQCLVCSVQPVVFSKIGGVHIYSLKSAVSSIQCVVCYFQWAVCSMKCKA